MRDISWSDLFTFPLLAENQKLWEGPRYSILISYLFLAIQLYLGLLFVFWKLFPRRHDFWSVYIFLLSGRVFWLVFWVLFWVVLVVFCVLLLVWLLTICWLCDTLIAFNVISRYVGIYPMVVFFLQVTWNWLMYVGKQLQA